MKLNMIIFAMIVVIFVPALCISAGVVIIAHPQISASALSKKEIANMFLGRKTIWDDRTKVVLFIQDDIETHQLFLKENIHKTRQQFSHHWKKAVLTGKASQLRILADDQEMIKAVGETEGAIGYVSSDAQLEHVKFFNIK